MESLSLLIILAAIGLIGAFIAHKKNRNKVVWFVLSALFMFPIIIVVFLPKVTSGEANEEGNLDASKKPLPIKKIVTIAIVIIFAIGYTIFLEKKKEETALEAKKELISDCNSDPACLEKIEKNFDTCIQEHLKIVKTGRRSREVRLDMQKLKACIGVTQK